MSRVIPPAFQASLDTRVTTTCLCWKIVRQDGLVLGFTDHDADLIFDGVTYLASTSFVASAIEDQLGLAVSNLDIAGAISADVITNDDLEAGRYDAADLTVYLVNWLIPVQRTVLHNGPMGQVMLGDLGFQAEMRSLAQYFQQYIVSLSAQKCRSDFGSTGSGLSAGCNFVLPAAVAGTIASVSTRSIFTVSAAGVFPDGTKGSLAGGYFAEGTVKFLDGNNAGLAKEVMLSTSTLDFTMKLPFPLAIQVGDAVELQIGCDKTLPVCRGNYDNVINRRCEDYVPGSDFVFTVNH